MYCAFALIHKSFASDIWSHKLPEIKSTTICIRLICQSTEWWFICWNLTWLEIVRVTLSKSFSLCACIDQKIFIHYFESYTLVWVKLTLLFLCWLLSHFLNGDYGVCWNENAHWVDVFAFYPNEYVLIDFGSLNYQGVCQFSTNAITLIHERN